MFVLPESINYSSHLSNHEKNLLRCLENHCGNKKFCWPGESRISRFMNVSIRTVQRVLRRLEELKLIEIIPRPGKSNKYQVLCLEERKVINTPDTIPTHKKNNSLEQKRFNGSEKPTWKLPAEIKLLLEDMEQVFGPEVTERNRGWFYKICKSLEDSWIYEALAWLRQVMLESEISGSQIRSLSALFTWRLRTMGAPI